ncbi:hypothetical protein M8J76_001449 [Diaphorina citri]|nr:hypothetical protein M8J76_001449 [Diaphorina citri]
MLGMKNLSAQWLPRLSPWVPRLTTPYDYFLFSNLKIWISGKRFTSKDDVSAPKKRYFEDFDGSCYLEGLKMWQGRWVKCVALKIDQVEK